MKEITKEQLETYAERNRQNIIKNGKPLPFNGFLLLWEVKKEIGYTITKDLRNANLSCADLSGLDLTNTDLRDAILSGANLTGANLSGANLSGAYIPFTTLSHSNFTNVILSAETILPFLTDRTNQTTLSDFKMAHVNCIGLKGDQAKVKTFKDIVKEDTREYNTLRALKTQQDAEAKAKQDADAKAKQEAEARAKQDADAKAKLDAEDKARQDAEAKHDAGATIKTNPKTQQGDKAMAKTRSMIRGATTIGFGVSALAAGTVMAVLFALPAAGVPAAGVSLLAVSCTMAAGAIAFIIARANSANKTISAIKDSDQQGHLIELLSDDGHSYTTCHLPTPELNKPQETFIGQAIKACKKFADYVTGRRENSNGLELD